MDKNKIGLGKGLSAILGEIDEETSQVSALIEKKDTSGITFLPLESLQPGKFQPRRVFTKDVLDDLVASIKTKGVLQPLLVRQIGNDRYEIIAGERRWRASKEAGLTQVPVIIKDFNDEETLEVSLIENLQRQDLNPLEEAQGYKRLLDEFKRTQEELARVVGKSRSYVANMLRLLDLPSAVKTYLDKGELTAGHARALLNAKNPEKLAKKVVEQGLSVRQTEQLAMTEGEKKGRAERKISVGGRKDGDIMALEAELSTLLKTAVTIRWTGKNGKITIECNSLEKLDVVLQRLTNGGEVEE
ncbi:MAG: ParB/RepB/Spo0J family partition protein [Alphaproteobacteria bacterium]|nr:ParB/RepB/Spo0J family partition protein [Alphaproteobacteria bacterium]